MNFNVYLDDALVRRLARLAKQTGSKRNAIIREAVADWVKRAEAVWPSVVLEWQGDPSIEPFEASRAELAEPTNDPFGSSGEPTSRHVRRGKIRRA